LRISLEQEIIAAKDANCSVLIQLDANAKVGQLVIPSDPNQISENGKLLVSLIERQNLRLQNISPVCKGAITRMRITKHGVEKSILDFIITCDKLSDAIEEMFIDEDQTFSLMKYATTKGNQKIIKSDHNLMIASFNMQFKDVSYRNGRNEVFNLKNKECQEIFSEVSGNNVKLKRCFESEKSFPEQCDTFFKTLDDMLHQSFRKNKGGKKRAMPRNSKTIGFKTQVSADVASRCE
jgi:hypothetical protein